MPVNGTGDKGWAYYGLILHCRVLGYAGAGSIAGITALLSSFTGLMGKGRDEKELIKGTKSVTNGLF